MKCLKTTSLFSIIISVLVIILTACGGGSISNRFSISGTVSGVAVSGVTVSLSGGSSSSTVTDDSGNYTFPGLGNGTYTVIPSLTGVTFSPASLAVTLNDSNVTSQNFTATKKDTGLVCGQTITEDTILDRDLICPPGTNFALIIGAPNITLDLGGHVISGYAPDKGVFAQGIEGITIRNGTIEGFEDGIFIIETGHVTIENLTVKNQNIIDPNHFITGVHIDSSQNIVVKDTLFEFPSVAHKEAVEVYNSDVLVSNIEVRGAGAGVCFSFNQVCDPVHTPSNGVVLNSKFSEICVAAIWVACTSNVRIAGNDISTTGTGGGIQADAPFLGAVTGLTVEENYIHDLAIGIEFRGITKSTISNNIISGNSIWGIALRQSLGCLTGEPGWECCYSTDNEVIDNQTSGNYLDLYHDEGSVGNIWERNTYETKEGSDIT